jgi:hypothetical protein
MTPLVGPVFGSTSYLVIGICPPIILMFLVETTLLGESSSQLFGAILGLLLFCLVLRFLMVVVADKSDVWVIWKLTGQKRLTPWSQIERLEGTRFRARLVLIDSGKKRTIAGFDPHWANRRVPKVITERIAATSERSAT